MLLFALLGAWWIASGKKAPPIKAVAQMEDTAQGSVTTAPATPTLARDESHRLRQEEHAKTIFQLIESSNVPISFWGKVIDQNEDPIANVEVTYTYTTEQGNMAGVAWGQQKVHNGSSVTSQDGVFSITGLRGAGLSIKSLQKEGYQYTPHQATTYDYYGSSAAGKFSSDPRNPVLFVMVNKAIAERLISYGGSFGKTMRLPGNGTPVRWSIWKGQPDPNGELQVTLKRDPAVVARIGQPVTWSAKIELIGGGIVEASPDDPIRRAPDNGYVPTIDYPKTEQRRGVPARSFYIRTSDGKYGRLELDLYPDDEGPTTRCLIKVSMNPTGSRNLESAQ
jgi:hypothetical protein